MEMSPVDGSNLIDRIRCIDKECVQYRLQQGFRLNALTLPWNAQAVLPV